MTPEEVRAYYDNIDNAAAMCTLLMRAHPGWVVWRERGFWSAPMWCASRETWHRRPPLMNENAGELNLAMFMADAGAVAS
jgi:hypothetical protein